MRTTSLSVTPSLKSSWNSHLESQQAQTVCQSVWPFKGFSTRKLPLAWRGGLLVPIWKGSGDHSECKNSRGTLLNHQVSKIVTQTLQTEIETHTGQWLQQEQFGCVNMRGTDMARLLVRTFISRAPPTGCCLWTLQLRLILPLVRKSCDIPLHHRKIHSTFCWIWVCSWMRPPTWLLN